MPSDAELKIATATPRAAAIKYRLVELLACWGACLQHCPRTGLHCSQPISCQAPAVSAPLGWEEAVVALVAALFVAGVGGMLHLLNVFIFFSLPDMQTVLMCNKQPTFFRKQTGFSFPNPVLWASCYHCCRAQVPCWFLHRGPDCAELNAELASQLLFSAKTTECYLCFLPAPCANIAVCILYRRLTVWAIFNKIVSSCHSPDFAFELLQALPFVFKCAAVERVVGKTRDHLSACSAQSSTAASFMLPWMEQVSPALLPSMPGELGGSQHGPLFPVDPSVCHVLTVRFVICMYTHQKHTK